MRNQELKKQGFAAEFDGPVSEAIQEDLLSDLFLLRPDLESIALESQEPLFIKNLENVQGDERDIILFSVGYGPDAEGRVSMNFGPLNRVGGERRLNVAVSRARYEMIIYSTLKADQIDLNRTSAIGVAGLKRFLEYAEKGDRVITNKQVANDSSASIGNIIADKIRELGYTVHTNIGCSGYKVDIGIVDKRNPSKYILGILCDGENYKQTKTVRDREIVQNSVLKLLGWNICRIWTMDWWENPSEVLVSIKELINNFSQTSFLEKELTIKNNILPQKSDCEDDLFVDKVTSTNMNISHLSDEQSVTKSNKGTEYQTANLLFVQCSSEEFLSSEHKESILKQIKNVVETEAPISRSLLCKKILTAWGVSRLGQRLDAYFDSLFEQMSYFKIQYEDLAFYWQNEE